MPLPSSPRRPIDPPPFKTLPEPGFEPGSRPIHSKLSVFIFVSTLFFVIVLVAFVFAPFVYLAGLKTLSSEDSHFDADNSDPTRAASSDAASFHPASLLPFGAEVGDAAIPMEERIFVKRLERPIRVFGEEYEEAVIHENGVISFDASRAADFRFRRHSNFAPDLAPFLAPLWTTAKEGEERKRRGRVVHFRETTDPNDLFLLRRHLAIDVNFRPEVAFVATWRDDDDDDSDHDDNDAIENNDDNNNNRPSLFQSIIIGSKNKTLWTNVYEKLCWREEEEKEEEKNAILIGAFPPFGDAIGFHFLSDVPKFVSFVKNVSSKHMVIDITGYDDVLTSRRVRRSTNPYTNPYTDATLTCDCYKGGNPAMSFLDPGYTGDYINPSGRLLTSTCACCKAGSSGKLCYHGEFCVLTDEKDPTKSECWFDAFTSSHSGCACRDNSAATNCECCTNDATMKSCSNSTWELWERPNVCVLNSETCPARLTTTPVPTDSSGRALTAAASSAATEATTVAPVTLAVNDPSFSSSFTYCICRTESYIFLHPNTDITAGCRCCNPGGSQCPNAAGEMCYRSSASVAERDAVCRVSDLTDSHRGCDCPTSPPDNVTAPLAPLASSPAAKSCVCCTGSGFSCASLGVYIYECVNATGNVTALCEALMPPTPPPPKNVTIYCDRDFNVTVNPLYFDLIAVKGYELEPSGSIHSKCRSQTARAEIKFNLQTDCQNFSMIEKDNTYTFNLLARQHWTTETEEDRVYPLSCAYTLTGEGYWDPITVGEVIPKEASIEVNAGDVLVGSFIQLVDAEDWSQSFESVFVGQRVRILVNTTLTGPETPFVGVKKCLISDRPIGDPEGYIYSLTDDSGCKNTPPYFDAFAAVEEEVVGGFNNTGDIGLSDPMTVFKFPGSTQLFIKCELRFCVDVEDLSCLTPNCPDARSGRRRRDAGVHSKIELSAVSASGSGARRRRASGDNFSGSASNNWVVVEQEEETTIEASTTTQQPPPDDDCGVQCYLVFAIVIFLGILAVVFVVVIVYVLKRIDKRLKVTPVAEKPEPAAPAASSASQDKSLGQVDTPITILPSEATQTDTPPNNTTPVHGPTKPQTPGFRTIHNGSSHATIAYGPAPPVRHAHPAHPAKPRSKRSSKGGFYGGP